MSMQSSAPRPHAPALRRAGIVAVLLLLAATQIRAQDSRETDSLVREQAPDTLEHRMAPMGAPSRQDTLLVTGGGPFLIRPFIQAGSEQVEVNGIQTSDYSLDAREGLISIPGVAADSNLVLVVSYRHVPLGLQSSYRLWGPYETGLESEDRVNARYPDATSGAQVSPGMLSTRGRITRGVLTGNNREARIESGLQLEVEGEVAPGVRMQASLSDEDTPLVPEGVTRQFDQFDRIQIGFESRQGTVQLGDFNAALEGTRYGVLRRKLQGAAVSTVPLQTGSQWISSLQVAAGAAISRGQFHSAALTILDGVQGPYRLTGAAGERFILVLPGTERVYLDGVLLERGSERDYVVDYQLGEITFTSRHVMGRERRVRVDYEYTTNRYTRTMTFSEARLGIGGTLNEPWARITVGGIREADGEAFVDESGLSTADSARVASSVDGQVQVDGATVVPYDAQALYTQYVRSNSTSGMEIWVELTTQPAEGQSVYRVPFSYLGPGNGSYVRIPSQGGGIAYEWVGPGEGTYEAIRTLPVPSRKSMGEVRLQVFAIPGLRIETGLAASSMDRNRLSSDPASIQQGTVADLAVSTSPLRLGRGWEVSAQGSGYRRTPTFETFERVRGIEFARNWALPILQENPFGSMLSGADERLGEIAFRLSRSDESSVEARLGRLALGPDVQSVRGHVVADLLLPRQTRMEVALRETEAEGFTSSPFQTKRQFARARVSMGAMTARWKPWIEVERDRWTQQGAGLQTLLNRPGEANRLPYRASAAGLERSWETHLVSVSGSLRREDDVEVDPTTRLAGSAIQTVQAAWDWSPSPGLRSRSSIGWRQTQPANPAAPSTQGRLNTLLIDLDGQVRSASAGIVGWNYVVRSEQTAAMQEVYIRTGPDRGHFVWQDINGDDRIQLDEFFPETTPGEGEYARTLFPSDSLESVTSAEARLTYTWLPTPSSARWRRASLNASVDVRETSRSENRVGVYLLRPSQLHQDGQTVNGRIRLSGRLGLYPLRRDRDLDVSVLRTASMAELASGTETTEQIQMGLDLREEVRHNLDLTLQTDWIDESAVSEQFATRAFDIRRWEIRPGGVLRVQDWRVQAEWMIGKGTEDGTGATVHTMRVPVSLFWNKQQMRWRTGGEWSDSAIKGGTPLGLQLFELTEGRGAGTSWMWHAHLDVQLTEIVSATLRYDGRRPTGRPTIHTGRFQLSARF